MKRIAPLTAEVEVRPRVKLRSFSISEIGQSGVEVDLKPVAISDFNLLIGDNAQGKTRFFNLLKFLRGLFVGQPKKISTRLKGEFEFDFLGDDEGRSDLVRYRIEIVPSDEGNTFVEWIDRCDRVLLSTAEKTLLNEATNQKLENFFIPKNVPALRAITEKEFVTISRLREFFQRLVFLGPGKSREVMIDAQATQLNDEGTNVASVLKNWKSKNRPLFRDTILELQRCFSLIRNVDFAMAPVQKPVPTELLVFKEKGLQKAINQVEWSDGIYRVLSLICLSKTVFNFEGTIYPASLICVDEIENGLDFKTLRFMLQYFRDCSDESQVILSSHSPLVCELIHPKDWKVVKRKGSIIEIKSPAQIESNLNEQLELFKNKHWDFYTKHISNSKLYIA